MNKVVILTSKKNFAWMSMQEIIPYICEEWLKISDTETDVKIVDVLEKDFKYVIGDCISATHIVCSCFTVEIINITKLLREKFSLDFKLYFYVHGLASVGMWPLLKWKLTDCLKESDTFIISNKRDKEALELVFENPTIFLHPFFIPLNKLNRKITPNKLLYVGRVSEQKNIHTLIIACGVLKSLGHIFHLDIIGGVDNLGSPNMGLASDNFLDYLNDLIELYNLEGQVRLHGHINRDELKIKLEAFEGYLISMSLHSDENFGVVPYHSLLSGESVILSDWGGYAEFKERTPEQVSLIDVYDSAIGPFVCLNSLLKILISTVSKKHNPSINNLEFNGIQLKEILNYQNHSKKLIIKPLLIELLKNRESYYKSGSDKIKNFGSQLFSGYDDSNAREFFRCYGAKNIINNELGTNLYLLPSVDVLSFNKVAINDRHRGFFSFESQDNEKVKLMSSTFEPIVLSKNLVFKLTSFGLIISLDI